MSPITTPSTSSVLALARMFPCPRSQEIPTASLARAVDAPSEATVSGVVVDVEVIPAPLNVDSDVVRRAVEVPAGPAAGLLGERDAASVVAVVPDVEQPAGAAAEVADRKVDARGRPRGEG